MLSPSAPLRDLVEHPLFDGAEAERYLHVLPHIRLHQAARGTVLHSPGAGAGLLHLVLRGQLQTFIVGPGSRQLVLELIEPGGFDGILPAAGQRGHFTEVTEEALLASMERRTLERLTCADPRIAANLLRLVTARLARREEHLETIALYQPLARLARQLLALADAGGRPRDEVSVLRRRLTHQMLADMLGLRRETVTIYLQRLIELGAIRSVGRAYWLDHGLLRRMANVTGTHFEDAEPAALPAGRLPAG